MDLEGYAIEIDGVLVGELKHPISTDRSVFVYENSDNLPDLRKLSSKSEIAVEGRVVNYNEFIKIIKDCYLTNKEKYYGLYGWKS